MTHASETLRPDKCGVIFEKLNDTIIVALARTGFNTLTGDIKKQLAEFNRQGFSVSISIFGNPVPAILPAAGKTAQAVFDEVSEHLKARKWQ